MAGAVTELFRVYTLGTARLFVVPQLLLYWKARELAPALALMDQSLTFLFEGGQEVRVVLQQVAMVFPVVAVPAEGVPGQVSIQVSGGRHLLGPKLVPGGYLAPCGWRG